MNRLASIFSKVVRQKVLVGLFTLAMLGVVGGGSEGLLSSLSAHATSSNGCVSYTVKPGSNLSEDTSAFPARHLCVSPSRHSRVEYAVMAHKAMKRVSARHLPTRAMPVRRVPIQPTPASHPPTSPTPPPVPGGGNSSVEGMIYQVFGPYASSAMRIARCESGLNPGAYNPTAIGNSHAAGVFQILYPSTWSSTPYASYSPYNAWANINAAHAIFVRDGYSWREWQCQG
jgi:hypothetical protein